MFGKIFLAAMVVAQVAALAVLAGSHPEDEYVGNEELILGHLDLNRLMQIRKDETDALKKCQLYDTELREMLGSLARDSMSSRSLFDMVRRVISGRRSYGYGYFIEGELLNCAALPVEGHKGKRVVDASYAPSVHAHPATAGGVDESVIISRLDFRALQAVATGSKNKKPAECETLAEELREMLGDLAVGLSQDDLFNRVDCVLDRRGAHFVSSAIVRYDLVSCLGGKEHLPSLDDTCWPHA